MTEPRNQYWRRIVPVVGEPIPDGAEWRANAACNWEVAASGDTFYEPAGDFDQAE